jgi:hypothetical protein
MGGLAQTTAAALAAHVSSLTGTQDEIYSPLYDSATYPAAGIAQLAFFQTQIGQGTTTAPGATGPKTEADTNMLNGGMLAKGNRFYCTGIEIQFFFGSSTTLAAGADANLGRNWADVYALMKSGWVRFRIQNRDYIIDGPLINFPSVTRLAGVASLTSTLTAGASTASNVDYATSAGSPYQLVPVYIEQTQGFSVVLNWPALVALPSTVAGRLFVRLRGRLIRDAQ